MCLQPKAAAKRLLDESDSDDSEGDTPLAKRMAASKPPPKPAAKLAAQGPVTKAAAKPASKPASKPVANGNAGIDDDFSEEDQTPLAKRWACGPFGLQYLQLVVWQWHAGALSGLMHGG